MTHTDTSAQRNVTLLEAALRETSAELVNLQDQRSDLLRAVARDPSKLRQVDKADKSIAVLQADLRTLNDSLAQAEQDAKIELDAQRIRAAAEDDAHVNRLAQERAQKLAVDLDQALGAALVALQRYVDCGHAAHGFASRAISTKFSHQLYRLQDAAELYLPRAEGNGTDAAAALATHIRQLIATLGGEAIKRQVVLDVPSRYGLTTTKTFAEAARNDAAILCTQFTAHKEAS